MRVPGKGPRDAKIMVLGEAPAREEVKLGYPFAGPAGKELDSWFSAANIDRKEVYITNASLEPVTKGIKKADFFFAAGIPTLVSPVRKGIWPAYRRLSSWKVSGR